MVPKGVYRTGGRRTWECHGHRVCRTVGGTACGPLPTGAYKQCENRGGFFLSTRCTVQSVYKFGKYLLPNTVALARQRRHQGMMSAREWHGHRLPYLPTQLTLLCAHWP